ncbi:IclR family transcriptional regulator [Providencia rettgeri]|uniref:IclR family transcriptional regulator n=1 Tax=Providencia rettgeri TaxID=587 RepID=UPI001B35E7E8|nr:IclR family transcriptional regulator [Providencia rettgeri]EJD6506498.1 IclR family transcriptional regulator [Providencia rettgeri]MBQ0314832.1 IclR family transcriptional regulator [Providencia rettgeri]MBQ0322901.1 IclR family transcriptional regulator [Providencia rettgeri]MBQ0348932.1 IclR family transcriptional regulator [Providencia rettgeri]MBQ0405322.1 IclR family transcriptional regulator [Providencia rettgeri]
MNSINRTLDILSYITTSASPVTPQAISSALGIPLSTVYRLLAILINWEFVSYAKQYGTYCVGSQSIKNQEKYYHHSLLMGASKQELQKLAKKTQETVAIITSNLRETICVDMIESEQALRCSFIIGRGNTLIKGASAKTLLAFRHEQYQTHVFETHAKQLAHEQSKFKLQQDLLQIQKQGYGVSISEIDEGVLGVSAPIFKGNDVLAVISVMAPEFRSTHRVDGFITHTCQTAHNITKLINLE